jgi:hypothetical protein
VCLVVAIVLLCMRLMLVHCTQLSEKVTALVTWANNVIQEEFKPTLTSIKYEVSQARTIDAAVQVREPSRSLPCFSRNVLAR